MNAARDLVQLPSSQHSITDGNFNFNMEGVEEPMLTYPNPFPSERAACGYAFDLVDRFVYICIVCMYLLQDLQYIL